MNIALRRPMSLAEFLAWEETAGTALRVRRIPTCRHGGRERGPRRGSAEPAVRIDGPIAWQALPTIRQ
jgi:hypothetical protein